MDVDGSHVVPSCKRARASRAQPARARPDRARHHLHGDTSARNCSDQTLLSQYNPSLLFLLVNSAWKVGNKLRWKEVLDPAPRSGSWVGQAEAPQVGRGTAARRAAHRLKNEMSSFAGIKRKLAKQAQDETNMLGHTKEGARVGTGQGQNKHGKTPITGLSGTHARRGRSEPDRAPWVGQRRRLRRLCY